MEKEFARNKILNVFFNFPTKTFYLREIAKKLNVSSSVVSKAFNELFSEKLIVLNKKGSLCEARANLENPIFIQLKRIYNLKQIYFSGLFEYLVENLGMEPIVLFGSYSRGEDIEKSDIDIAIMSHSLKKMDLGKFEKILFRNINLEVIEFKKAEKELKNSIINGVVLRGQIGGFRRFCFFWGSKEAS